MQEYVSVRRPNMSTAQLDHLEGGLHRFVFVDRTHADLSDPAATRKLLFITRPTRIIHLAAKTAPMETMARHHAEHFTANQRINSNVLQASAALATSGLLGVTDVNATLLRVLSCLSSVMLPAGSGVESEVTEADVSVLSKESLAAVRPLTAGYGAAKLQQLQLSSWITKETPALSAVTLMPSRVFGPPPHCAADGPLGNVLLAKAAAAARSGSPMVVDGSGQAQLQLLFSGDLAKVIVWSLEHYNDANEPMAVTGGEGHSVQELAELASTTAGFTGEIVYTETESDGPPGLGVSSAKLKALMPRLAWTPLGAAMASTMHACDYLTKRRGQYLS